jgi:3-oxoacyl-[acyl-carrier protein] reductase
MCQKILVTGASVGIGRQIAVAFARQGAWVIINYRQAEEDAQETLHLVEQVGGKGHIVKADVSNEREAAELVKKSADILGGLDVLVNNAGITKFIPFVDLDAATVEVWDSLYKTNVESVFFCSREAAKIMRKQEAGGNIVNVASVSGMLPRGSSIPYAVSKAAIIHLTKCLAQTLAPKIRVNCVSPAGTQNTRWNKTNPSYDSKTYQTYAQNIPLKRSAEPQDIASAVIFLASDAANFITGVNLPVEGGLNIK